MCIRDSHHVARVTARGEHHEAREDEEGGKGRAHERWDASKPARMETALLEYGARPPRLERLCKHPSRPRNGSARLTETGHHLE